LTDEHPCIGDDCALISIDHGKQLATTVDALIEGVHFPASTSAQDIAYKALAVNLSDLAAMGATPLYFTLALLRQHHPMYWKQI
jgi:thiamine-monophosphate kinase